MLSSVIVNNFRLRDVTEGTRGIPDMIGEMVLVVRQEKLPVNDNYFSFQRQL